MRAQLYFYLTFSQIPPEWDRSLATRVYRTMAQLQVPACLETNLHCLRMSPCE